MSISLGIKRMGRAVTYIKMRMLNFLLNPIGKLLYRGKHIWIVSERGTDARDNGYHFYRYVRERHPEQRAYYIIDRKSPDYPKVAALGNVVQRGSLKHWLLYLGAEVKISSHMNGFTPDSNWHYLQFVSRRRRNDKNVFLQHGVTKDDLKPCYRNCTNINLFICGAKPEYDYILSRYGYSESELKYTGFARFDSLHNFTTRRQVLIMPTWRSWLSAKRDGVTWKDVENSTYLKCWTSVLRSGRLQKMAKKYGISFVFYPHYEVQSFLHLFGKSDEGIEIADFAHYDVQQLLKESMLLITDYSSVFFDFAYMRKPVIYYQFDEEEYRAQHYRQGYFDYQRDGFGEVVTEQDALFDLLEQYLENGCSLKPEYRERIQGFFPLQDRNNCERIYKEIMKL